MIKKIELLAPAGDLERLKWAFLYGADAVYIGGQDFSLRANANNFSLEEIREACIYAHNISKRVYVTVNIIFHNDDILNLEKYLIELDKIGVDAIIIADPLVNELVKKNHLTYEVHLSTQQSTLNSEAALFWQTQGIKRIVLAREANKDNIKNIINKTKMDVEVFIHGSMCAAYSGRCVMSNYLTLRDANRGGCAQVCRFDFNLYDHDYQKIVGEKPFSMCTKDLSMLKYLPDLIEMGVVSLKIEGRMRSNYYIATVVSIYRQTIDRYYAQKEEFAYNNQDEFILNRCSNRESIPQFFAKLPGVEEQYYNGRCEVSNQDFLGIVLAYDKENKEVILTQRNFFKLDDKITIFGKNTNIDTKVEYIKDIDNNYLEAARHPEQIVKIALNKEVYPNDLIRIKI